MKLDPKVYRDAAERIRCGQNCVSCVAIYDTLLLKTEEDIRWSDAYPYSKPYEQFTCQDGRPEWWGCCSQNATKFKAARIAALEAFAEYLERTGGEL